MHVPTGTVQTTLPWTAWAAERIEALEAQLRHKDERTQAIDQRLQAPHLTSPCLAHVALPHLASPHRTSSDLLTAAAGVARAAAGYLPMLAAAGAPFGF